MTAQAKAATRGVWGTLGRALLASACALGWGCDKGDTKNTYAPPPPPEVIVANPIERDVVTYLTYTGVVEASEKVELRARVQGFLEKMEFQPGQRVKRGDLLFTIDKREYEAAFEQATASVAATAAALVGAESDASLARELADQKAGPEIDAIIKAARRDTVQAELAGARAKLIEAKLNLEYCEIRAPIDGRVTDNYVDVGNLVGRNEPTLLAEIVLTSPAYVSVDVSEADVIRFRREQPLPTGAEPGQVAPGEWRACELAIASEGEFNFKGHIDYVDPQLNAQTGTLRVRTRYENADERLVPGFFSRVRVAMKTNKALLTPEAALLSDQQGRFAMVVNEKDEVEARRVRIGVLDGNMRVVEEGLAPTDRVVVLGVLKARPGSKVTPKTQQPQAAGR